MSLLCRDKYGRRVFVDAFGAWDPDKIPFSHALLAGIKLFEILALEPRTQVSGLTAVIDGAGFGAPGGWFAGRTGGVRSAEGDTVTAYSG